MIQVESPRLPFRDWVHGIKLNNSNEAGGEVPVPLSSSGGQRDSGLALQCYLCGMDPCQCGGGGSYADQLSAFMTPAPGQGLGAGQMMLGANAANLYGSGMVTPANMSKAGNNMYDAGGDHGEIDWAAHYGGDLMSAGGLLTAPSNGALGPLSEDHKERLG